MVIAQYPIEVSRYTPVEDPFSGELGDGWGPPETVYAYSIGPRGTELGKDLVTVTGLAVGLPVSYGLTSRDRVILDGELWEVDGDLVNANRGPWTWRPGFVAYLTRSRTL